MLNKSIHPFKKNVTGPKLLNSRVAYMNPSHVTDYNKTNALKTPCLPECNIPWNIGVNTETWRKCHACVIMRGWLSASSRLWAGEHGWDCFDGTVAEPSCFISVLSPFTEPEETAMEYDTVSRP